MQSFSMKDLGQSKWFLGIRFNFKDDSITMDQESCLENMLDKFNMHECNDKTTPCDINITKVNESDSRELADPHLYRQIVGSLIYVISNTVILGPDLC